MARKLISKRMEMFSSCLLYTCETVSHKMVAALRREHHLPDHNAASSPPDQAEPETIPAAFRPGSGSPGQRIKFPPPAKQPSSVQVSPRLGLQTSNLGHCGTASSTEPSSNLAELFTRTGVYVAFILCECKFKGNNCIKRILCSFAQLYTFVCALWTALFLSLWPVTTALHCVPVYRRFAVPLCTINALLDSVSGW